MPFLRPLTLLAGGVLALSGCGSGSSTGPNSRNLTLSTDRGSYTAVPLGEPGPFQTYGFTLIATFTNRSVAPVFLGNCSPDGPPTYSVLLVDSPVPFGSGYSPAWACAGHDRQLLVAPRSTFTDTLFLFGPTATDGVTHEPLGALTGEMRLSYEVQSCRGDGACRIEDAGLSRAFSVTIQP